MREQERKLLDTPLPPDTNADGAERELRRVLGVHSHAHERLRDRLVARLIPAPPALGSWSLDEQRLVLIADHHYASTTQVAEHLVYAVYDQWEAIDQWERCEAKIRRSLNSDGQIKLPAPTTVGAFLAEDLSRKSMGGVFARIASAMDCLAVPIIVGLRLPINVLTASFNGVHDYLITTTEKRARKRLPAQSAFGQFLTQAIEQAGPTHWRDWCMDYRQMVVHRGQRTSINYLTPEWLVLDPSGRPVPRLKQTVTLLSDPDLSNVEAFVQFSTSPLTLTEPAASTLCQLIESMRSLVDRVCAELLRLDDDQTVARALGGHPLDKQWPTVRRMPTHTFAGYTPGAVQLRASHIAVSPVDEQRLRAASAHEGEAWRDEADPEP
jgi:hypothetical protein